MIDSFDYKEPRCSLCDGKDFYYPDKDAPLGRIPVQRIIEKLDSLYNKNDISESGRLLTYWQKEAQNLKDLQGELSILNELLGYYRKVNLVNEGLLAIDRTNFIIDKLNLQESFSVATIYLNMATTLKAFKQPEQALVIYEKTFKIYSKTTTPPELWAGYYNNFALTLVDLGEFEKAENNYFLALEKLVNTPNYYTDSAITQVNLAHLYEVMGKADKITDCIFNAVNLLFDEKIIKNGYYAFVLEKCAPSFKHFGFDKLAVDCKTLSEKIYEGN